MSLRSGRRFMSGLGLSAACLLVSCASLFGRPTHRIEDWESACFEHNSRPDCIDLDRKYEAAEKAESVTSAELAQLRQKRCRVRRKHCELDGSFIRCTSDLVERCAITEAQAAIEAEQLMYGACQTRNFSACVGYLTQFRDLHPSDDPERRARVDTVEDVACEVRDQSDCDWAIRRAVRSRDLKKAETLARHLRCSPEAKVKVCEAEVGAHLQSLLRFTLSIHKLSDADKLVVQQLAAANLTRGCELGEPGGCILLLRDLDALPLPPRLTTAAAGLLKICEGGDKAICLEAAYLLATEETVRDTDRAETLVRDVCPTPYCLLSSALRMYGGGAQESGVRLLREGCDTGDAQHCKFLCSTMARLKNPQPAEAVQRCQTACESGIGESCWELSRLYASGQQVRKDVKRARVLLQQACDKGSEIACFELKPQQHHHASVSDGLSALGKILGSMAKVAGGLTIAPFLLPTCALAVKNNPMCPVNWIK